MARSKKPITADLLQVLLWCGQPEIILLKRSSVEYIVAIGIDHPTVAAAYLGASVTMTQLADYQAERFDLRYLLTHPALRKWYLVDLAGEGPTYSVASVPKGDPLIREALPDSGLFARGHDSIKSVDLVSPTAVEKFDIDGSWDLGEFSKFYGQVEDIYYIFNSLERFYAAGTSAADKAKISEAFLRPWQGGGSYLGFYGKIANDNDRAARLRVSGIRYHSPGYVEIKARQAPFDEMIHLLDAFSRNAQTARKQYDILYKYLSSNGLLKAPDTVQLPDTIKEGIEIYAKALTECMENIMFDAMHEMASGNVLVAAKVVLSIYRRTQKLYSFFEQGRVHYTGLNADPGDDMIV